MGFTPQHLRSPASWGLPPEPGPRAPQRGGSRGCVAGGAGCGAPSVRLGDRRRLLLRFRASGRSAPVVVPTSALRGQSCQLLSPVPKSGHAEEPLPQTQLLPGETQLRANPEDDTQAETRGGPGLRAAPGRGEAAVGAGRTGCAWGRPGVGRGPGHRGLRALESAPAGPRRRGPGAAPAAGPRGAGAGRGRVSGPRPGPAPLRGRLGRGEEKGSPRAAGGAPLLHAPGRVSGTRTRSGRGAQPRRAPAPRDQGRRQSRGPGEARPARGRGPWRDSCGRAGIFSLNPAVPCSLQNPRALPLPNA